MLEQADGMQVGLDGEEGVRGKGFWGKEDVEEERSRP
jgi:hypothetical protein